MSAPTPAPVPPSSPEERALSPRLQAGLFALLVGLALFVAWRTSAPPTRLPEASAVRIDLNRAEAVDLAALPGVGPALAQRIVAHRNQHGPFDGLADLRKVSGIGDATLAKLRPHVQLSWADEPAPGPTVPRVVPAKATTPTLVLDPNDATLEQLDQLPGIGPVIAKRIVETRERKPFESIADLRRVPGIGAKTLEKLRPHLALGAKKLQ